MSFDSVEQRFQTLGTRTPRSTGKNWAMAVTTRFENMQYMWLKIKAVITIIGFRRLRIYLMFFYK